MLRIINKLKNKRGFTLIELIVVLAVPVSYTHLDVYKRQVLLAVAG